MTVAVKQVITAWEDGALVRFRITSIQIGPDGGVWITLVDDDTNSNSSRRRVKPQWLANSIAASKRVKNLESIELSDYLGSGCSGSGG